MHFAILKVGPAATFALREAIYALDLAARELPGWTPAMAVRDAMEAAMLRDPAHWQSHYGGDEARRAYLRHFGYSDRLRYYWTDPAVEAATAALFGAMDTLPLPLVGQYFPQHLATVAEGTLAATPEALCAASVQHALAPYADACGLHAAVGAAG